MDTAQPDAMGTVVAIWRYPVKSMMGEELNAVDVTLRGVAGDRAYAVIDSATGKVASAKNPTKWGRLFECRASYHPDAFRDAGYLSVHVTLPDGCVLRAGDDQLNERLSALFERTSLCTDVVPDTGQLEEYWPEVAGRAYQNTVTDQPIASRTFFDGALVHLMTTATLDALRAAFPAGRFENRRFRPNLVVASLHGEQGFIENRWIDRTITIGSDLVLRVIAPCIRCVMTTLPQCDLPEDRNILRTAVQQNQAAVGVYATVTGLVGSAEEIWCASRNPAKALTVGCEGSGPCRCRLTHSDRYQTRRCWWHQSDRRCEIPQPALQILTAWTYSSP